MKHFVISLFQIFFLVLLTLEVTIRSLGLAGNHVPVGIIDGEYRLLPGSKGTFVKGPFKEIEASYSINEQGYNSIVNYQLDSADSNYAIIGDSYIEGLHVNVEGSIGRLVEGMLQSDKFAIHEFGLSGWNVYNYLDIANRIQNKYNKLYILIDESDFVGLKAIRPVPNPESRIKKYLFHSHLVRYLYYNRGLVNKLKDFKNQFCKPKNPKVSGISNKEILSIFPQNTVFLYTESGLDTTDLTVELLEIREIYKPKDWGLLDEHWNHEGRLNCASAICDHILKEKR